MLHKKSLWNLKPLQTVDTSLHFHFYIWKLSEHYLYKITCHFGFPFSDFSTKVYKILKRIIHDCTPTIHSNTRQFYYFDFYILNLLFNACSQHFFLYFPHRLPETKYDEHLQRHTMENELLWTVYYGFHSIDLISSFDDCISNLNISSRFIE